MNYLRRLLASLDLREQQPSAQPDARFLAGKYAPDERSNNEFPFLGKRAPARLR